MRKIYELGKDYIKVFDCTNFVAEHILDCGQIFRYKKVEDRYEIISNNRSCTLIKEKDCVIIKCKDVEYFVKYFDLDRDYTKICSYLSSIGLEKETRFGSGIRILNQEPFEMLISFIISANNHIPRIKAIIERLSSRYGKNCGDYYAFPTVEELSVATVEELRELGCGYRAEYIVDTVKAVINTQDYADFDKLDDVTLRRRLMQFKGVGGKVADCIMLFGYKRTASFPVDTWIVKAFGREKSEAKKLEKELTSKYGELSGFAQQYIFYYNRENSLK